MHVSAASAIACRKVQSAGEEAKTNASWLDLYLAPVERAPALVLSR
jgi:hypothetical protein